MLQYIPAANETERECFSAFENPLSTLRMGLFYMLKGSPTGGNVDKGKNGKGIAVGTTTCTVYPT